MARERLRALKWWDALRQKGINSFEAAGLLGSPAGGEGVGVHLQLPEVFEAPGREGSPTGGGIFLEFLEGFEPSTPRALETIGSWYWVVDEIEARGLRPRLVHARGAKVMMGMVDKSDRLDARGLGILQRTGTLPEVWIPSGEIRDKGELPRSRMLLVQQRTRFKQRALSNLAKYGFVVSEVEEGVREGCGSCWQAPCRGSLWDFEEGGNFFTGGSFGGPTVPLIPLP